MRFLIPLMLLAACGTPSSKDQQNQDVAPDPTKPDQVALAIPTRIEARRVTIVLGTQWRDRVTVEAVHVDRSNPDAWKLSGSAVIKVGRVEVKASDEAKISFLPNYEHFVLHATFVKLLERDKGYTHRHTDLHMATIADGELNVFSR